MKRPGAKRASPQVPNEDRCDALLRDYKTKQVVRCTRRATMLDAEQRREPKKYCNTHDPAKMLERRSEARRLKMVRSSARADVMKLVAHRQQLAELVVLAALEHTSAEYELARSLGVPYAATPLSEAVDAFANASANHRAASDRLQKANHAVRTKRRSLPSATQEPMQA